MKRKITHVIRRCTHSNSGYEHNKPYTMVGLSGCVHEIGILDDAPSEPGTEVECTQCGDLEEHKQRIMEFAATGNMSHVTRRSCAANRCRAWESLNVYRRDDTSPTRCILEFSVPACDELEVFFASIGKRSVLGPSRGEMALL